MLSAGESLAHIQQNDVHRTTTYGHGTTTSAHRPIAKINISHMKQVPEWREQKSVHGHVMMTSLILHSIGLCQNQHTIQIIMRNRSNSVLIRFPVELHVPVYPGGQGPHRAPAALSSQVDPGKHGWSKQRSGRQPVRDPSPSNRISVTRLH